MSEIIEPEAGLLDALRYEPCSPTCTNWLRYGIQPKNPREGMRPGACKGKAHRADMYLQGERAHVHTGDLHRV